MASYGKWRVSSAPDYGRMGAVELIAANLRGAMCGYGRATGRGEQLELDSATLVNSGVDYGVFNAMLPAYPIESAESLESDLREASRYYASHRMGWSLWLCEDLIRPGAVMQARGRIAGQRLRRLADHHGMLAESIQPSSQVLPELEVRPGTDEKTRSDFARVISQVFAVPIEVAMTVYRGPGFWQDGYVAWVGYANKRAICCMATHTAAGTIGIYSVATLAAFRGRGIGQAITRHGLNAAVAAAGALPSILQSTPAGLSMYRKMGFAPLASFSVFLAT